MTTSYTGVGNLTFAKAAYDQMAYHALRPQLYFDGVADVKPTRQSMPGSSVAFTIVNDLAIASSPLNESTDVTAVALSDSQVTLTLTEYGNAAITTAKLRGESFVDIDPVVANVLGYNAGVSIDELAKNKLQAGTNVFYSQGTATTAPTSCARITPQNTIRATDVRHARAYLVKQNVPEVGQGYLGFIHPDTAIDLRQETGSASWRTPHVYSQPGEVWTGEVGMFEGVRFIETPRAPVFVDAGSSPTTTTVYATLFLGRQALAKCWSIVDGNGPLPHTVPGPIVDKLRRFVPWGWYWLGQYGVFRQASIIRCESSSSQTFTEPTIDQ